MTEQAAAALARLYDLDLVEDPGDLDLYLALAARAGGRVLELAAGTGRLAVPLAEAGYDVTAVDIDPAMLARARARALGAGVSDRVHLVEADLRELRLPAGRAFSLAFIALNSLLVLRDRRSQASALETLARHLAPDGIAVVDVWLPDADDLSRFDGRLSLEYPRFDPETGRFVTKIASAIHEASTASVRLSTIYEEGHQGEAPIRWFRQDVLRLVSADELRSFAEDADLVVERIAGGYDLEALGPGSDRAVLIAVRG